MTGTLTFGVLGPLIVRRDGEPVRLGGPKEKLILGMLLAAEGRVVSVDRLVDVLWGDDPPSRAVATLQVHVSHLRGRLGDARPTVVTQAPGYVLAVTSETLDLLRFDELAEAGRQAMSAGDSSAAASAFAEADALWQGEALADLAGNEYVEATRTLLQERRASVGEARVNALLESGRADAALPVISQLLGTFPLRETLWAARMLALYRQGRQAEALAAYRECRERLLDELGVEPSTPVRDLHRAILDQDASLDHRPSSRPEADGTPAPGDLSATFLVAQYAAELSVSTGDVVPLSELTSIGRQPDSSVVLPDASVSRRHADIRPALGGHLLLDLGSSNGTRIAGELVLQHLLADGDEIQIGPYVLTYRRVGGDHN